MGTENAYRFARLHQQSFIRFELVQAINNRIERYGKVLEEIANDLSKSAVLPSMLTTAEEKKNAAAAIAGDIYNISPAPKRTFVLLRLDAALSSGEATYDFDTITVEHILPQTPDANSQWVEALARFLREQ